jgi:hypothetical protein
MGWDSSKTHEDIALSGTGDVTATATSNVSPKSTIGADGASSGKKYFEIRVNARTSNSDFGFGICGPDTTEDDRAGGTADAWAWCGNSYARHDGANVAYVYGIAANTTIRVAVDIDNGKMYFGRDANWLNGSNPAAGTSPQVTDADIATVGTLFPHASLPVYNNGGTLRTTEGDFQYAPPTGFDAWESGGSATNYTLTAGGGSFAETGTAATLSKEAAAELTIEADAAAFSVTGAAVSFAREMVISAGAGEFALSGSAADISVGAILSAAPGAFVLSGTAAGFTHDRNLLAVAGGYAVTGNAAGLSTTSSPVLDCAPGAAAVSGPAAGLFFSRKIESAGGAFALSGVPVDFYRGAHIQAGAGSVVAGGLAVELCASRTVPSGAGAFAVVGESVAFGYSGFVLPSGRVSLMLSARQPAVSLTTRKPGVLLTARAPGVSLVAR